MLSYAATSYRRHKRVLKNTNDKFGLIDLSLDIGFSLGLLLGDEHYSDEAKQKISYKFCGLYYSVFDKLDNLN